jgi:hypothetical protein
VAQHAASRVVNGSSPRRNTSQHDSCMQRLLTATRGATRGESSCQRFKSEAQHESTRLVLRYAASLNSDARVCSVRIIRPRGHTSLHIIACDNAEVFFQ